MFSSINRKFNNKNPEIDETFQQKLTKLFNAIVFLLSLLLNIFCDPLDENFNWSVAKIIAFDNEYFFVIFLILLKTKPKQVRDVFTVYTYQKSTPLRFSQLLQNNVAEKFFFKFFFAFFCPFFILYFFFFAF